MTDVKRKLAAILSADVAGYSRLMRADEETTLARLSACRERIDESVGRRDGRVVGSAGDSVLVEFASPLEAVRAAVDIHSAVEALNADVPEDERMRFRIGINLGDVMVKGDDLFGDGVNVAARLQGLAEVGGIAVSGAVHDQVRNAPDLRFEDLGAQSVKNIAEPVRVFRVVTAKSRNGRADRAAAPTAFDKPSIAVLPFENMSGDAEQEYFSDGISEDIITDLSKVSGLFVIARNSTFAYKGTNPSIRDVSRDLGVRYVLEGSVRKAGNRVRVTAQLIDGGSGGHLWAERYDRDLTDIFTVQDELTQEIVGALQVTLTRDEEARLGSREAVHPEAYDCCLRGRECAWRFTEESSAEARTMFQRAIELDPELALAHAGLSLVTSTDYANDWNGATGDNIARAVALAESAVARDPNEPHAHFALAVARLWLRQLDAAEEAAERALAVDPNFAIAYGFLGRVKVFRGEPEAAIELFRKVMRLDPQYPDLLLQFLGHAQFMLGRYDEAEATFKRRLLRKPQSDVTRVFLASLYGHTGRLDEARRMWAEALDINPGYSLEHVRQILPYADERLHEPFLEGLRKAGLP